MAITPINVGTSANDGTGDPLRTAFNKLNTNFLNITADGGDEITVTDPTTSTDGTLNDALANIYASGGTPDLQAVTDAGNTTTNPILIKDGTDTIVEIFNNAGEGAVSVYVPGGDNATLQPNSLLINEGADSVNYKGNKIVFNSVDYPLPTGASSQIATLADITGGGYTVVSSNQTAVNDTNYTVVANATFTDPTPTEGKGYVVYVRNGTATIGGTGYAVGSLVFRVYHSLAWSTREYKSNLTLDTTPTDGSTNAVESNGVFDALALKSNVNRSETFIFSKANGTFGSHTGNTTETVILTSTITGGVFEIGDWMNLMYDFSVTGTAGTKTIRFRAGTTGTTADALIGSAFFTAGVLDFGWSRERLQFKTGNILSGIANNYTAQGFDIVGNTAAKQSTSLNPSNNWILSVTVQLANSADTVSCDGYVISRVKSF